MKETNLPENAFRELREGEEYQPLMEAGKQYREVTPWSITWGILMAILFSAATAYLGLKVGQVFEAAIPITIIAVGVAGATHRKDPMGENVIIQSIGACSGMIVAGAIFTLPALYILQHTHPEITVNFLWIFLASLLGGALGILLLIPFRKYFVKDMHGKYPFPEATASTQILLSGEKSGSSAKPLLVAGLIGGLYDFAVATFGLWNENFTSRCCELGSTIADKAKLVFSCNTSAALLGMGFIVGLKYATIICAGSALVWWGIVPAISLLFPDLEVANGVAAGNASAEQIFGYAKSIGIGAIAMAGIIGVVKSWGVIKSAFALIGKISKGSGQQTEEVRTQRDLSMKIIAIGTMLTIMVTTIFFFVGPMEGNLLFTIVGILIVAVIAFLFTTVAANAIAIVGSNPVSGMTLMTLILASLIMVAVGLNGTAGMTAALIIGGVVCTALSVAGAFITDLKIGYWIGSTPKKQESWKFLGTLVAAATVGGVMLVLNKTYGFTGEGALVAPQANAMAAVIEPMMNGGSAPWLLYGIGAIIALVLTFFKVPALPFALGMFIPIDLNMPMLIGGAVSWFVGSRSKDKELNAERTEKGTLIASGFIAGGALMGVVSAILRFANVDLYIAPSAWTEPIAIIPYTAIIIYMAWAAMKAKKD